MTARGAVFLDRDGVVNVNRDDYVRSWEQFQFLPGAIEAVRCLTEAGWSIVIVTNQSGVGRGLIDRGVVDDIHVRMVAAIEAAGGRVARVALCPHTPDDRCRCRKPAPGMLRDAARDLGVDLRLSWMVGDHPTDAAAGRRAGCRAVLVRSGRGGALLESVGPDITVVDDLAAAVAHILNAERPDADTGRDNEMTTPADYFALLAETLVRIDNAAVERLVDAIRRARDGGGMIYTLGNGGSAATASHLALDLAKNTRRADRANMRVFSLTDNAGLVTAWANDSRYEDVFSAQLDAVVQAHDLVIAISGSGNSPNVINAVQTARAHGARTFGITGFAGGRLVGEADDCVIVPSDNMQVVEDGHMAITHAVMVLLRDEG